MSIKFLTAGILTTIQDLGRNGERSSGINPGGAMDKIALRLTNILLGNDENEAALEIHFPAPKILFEESALIVLGGADFDAEIDGNKVSTWQTIWVEKGQTLSFTEKLKGNRLYLGIKGGFQVEDWLNSKSTNLKAKLGGFEGRQLQKNDVIKFKSESPDYKPHKPLKLSKYFAPYYPSFPKIRIIEGAEFNLLTALSLQDFFKRTFTISQDSDRMGFRLNGQPLHLMNEKELVSSCVTFGTIQLLPTGQMIVLMADHQTTGGYPRIGNVISQDLQFLAQLGANDKVCFETISIEDAEKLELEFEHELNILKTGVKFYGFN